LCRKFGVDISDGKTGGTDLPWVVADYCTYESSRAAVRVVINDVQTDRYAQP